jgi:hypothetical protein
LFNFLLWINIRNNYSNLAFKVINIIKSKKFKYFLQCFYSLLFLQQIEKFWGWPASLAVVSCIEIKLFLQIDSQVKSSLSNLWLKLQIGFDPICLLLSSHFKTKITIKHLNNKLFTEMFLNVAFVYQKMFSVWCWNWLFT